MVSSRITIRTGELLRCSVVRLGEGVGIQGVQAGAVQADVHEIGIVLVCEVDYELFDAGTLRQARTATAKAKVFQGLGQGYVMV